MEQQTKEADKTAAGPAKHPPFRFTSRGELAAGYLSGDGIEIGALHSPTPIPAHARTLFVDRKSSDDLREEYAELADLDLIDVDLVDDGETLGKVPDESVDYIIANHFLEHTEDPIGTIGNHLRKLKAGGVLFYTVPDKRYTFDFRRPVTPVEHMIRDHEEGPSVSRQGHYEEFTLLTVERPDTGNDADFEKWAAKRAAKLEAENASIHMHVWTQAEFLTMILHCRERFDEIFDIEAAVRIGPEFVVVLRKQEF